MTAPTLHFRRAEERDVDRVVEIHGSAFPDPRGVEARRRNFLHNRLGALDELRVVEADGVIVAHAFLFALQIGFGGVRVPSGGVATVGVAPEARGKGVAAALLRHLHAEAEARGDALTALYPFRAAFYAKHGYAPVSPARRLSFHPRAVPDAWRRSASPARAATGVDLAGIHACYDRALLRGTGNIVRTPRSWERRLLEERARWFVMPGAEPGDVRGYMGFSLVQAEAHARTTMVVRELVADDDETRRALVGLLGTQRDQVAEITLEVPEDDPLDRALLDADQARFGTEQAEHVVGDLVTGPMVRLTDVPRALAARGYGEDGALEIALPEVQRVYRLTVNDGRGHAEALNADAAPEAPRISTNVETLGALVYGGLRARDAARLGWLSTGSMPDQGSPSRSLARAALNVADARSATLNLADARSAALNAADALLGLPPYFALDPF